MSVLKALSLLAASVLVLSSACSNLNESSSRTADNANQALKPAVEAISDSGQATGRVAENTRGALRPAVEKLQATPKATSNVLGNASDIIKSPLGKTEKDKEKEAQ